MAKALIMLVRVFGLVAIVIGGLLWSGRQQFLGPHIGGGFFVALVVLVLAVVAMSKRAIIPGILGVVFALLLPVVGFMQFPLQERAMGAVQAGHVVLALATIGVAESLYAAIRRAS